MQTNCFKVTFVISSLSHKLVHVPCILSIVYLGKPPSHSRKAELIWMELLSIFISFLNILLPRVNSTVIAIRNGKAFRDLMAQITDGSCQSNGAVEKHL